MGLVVNVDVSNCCFWGGNWQMTLVATQLTGKAVNEIGNHLAKVQTSHNSPPQDPVTLVRLRKLKKVGFSVNYRNASEGKLLQSI